MNEADVEIEEPEITVADINSKLSDLPRGSYRRSVLRMLSVGVRPHEITSISEISYMKVRRMLNEMFPEQDVSPHDFRRRFILELAEGDLEVRKSNYLLDHQSYKSISALEKKVQEEEERQSVRYLLDNDPLEGVDDYAGHSEVDLEGLPEEVQEQLEDTDFESGEELLGRFHLYLTNETGLSPGDTVDYAREMDYQLGLNPDDYPAKQYTHEDELTSSARDRFSEFLDSSYAEKPEKASGEGGN